MPAELTLRQLRAFVVLAEELHFGRAAARLGVAQPALSQQLRTMESGLGATLLSRKPRVALTHAGETMLAEAREVIARVEQATIRTRKVAAGAAGPLAIGFAASAVLTDLPAIIQRYRHLHPDVELALRELSPAEEMEAVRSGAVHVGFLREVDAHPDLRCRTVVREPFAVLLPARHELASSTRVRIEQLAQEPFVHFPSDVSPTLHRQIAALCTSGGFAPRVVQATREWLTEISLVQAGVGVAIVPASFRRLKLGGVKMRPITGAAVFATLALCVRRDSASPAASAFFELANRAFAARSV